MGRLWEGVDLVVMACTRSYPLSLLGLVQSLTAEQDGLLPKRQLSTKEEEVDLNPLCLQSLPIHPPLDIAHPFLVRLHHRREGRTDLDPKNALLIHAYKQYE